MPKKPADPEDQNQWRQAGLAMTIPTMMVSGPLLGWLLGMGIERWLDLQPPWSFRIRATLVILCTVAAGRETIKIIKRISGEPPPTRPQKP